MAESQHAEAQKQFVPERVKHAPEPEGEQAAALIQRATVPSFQGGRIDPRQLTPQTILYLQRTIGNQAVGQLLQQQGLRRSTGLMAESSPTVPVTPAHHTSPSVTHHSVVARVQRQMFPRVSAYKQEMEDRLSAADELIDPPMVAKYGARQEAPGQTPVQPLRWQVTMGAPSMVYTPVRRLNHPGTAGTRLPSIQRVVSSAQANIGVEVVNRTGDIGTITAVDNTKKYQGNPIGVVVKIFATFGTVKKEFFSTNDDYTVKGGQAQRPVITQVFRNPDQYSFEGWFTYLAKELPDGDLKEKLITWGMAYRDGTPLPPHTFDDTDKLAQLQAMLSAGFVGKQETGMLPASQAFSVPYHGQPKGAEKGYESLALPDLQKTGLVYRSDSRLYSSPNPSHQTIRKHGGSLARSRLDDNMLIGMNMDKPWNPFRDRRLRETLLLRKQSVDNDLRNVVSVAVDPRDSVKFPLPGGEGAGVGGTDTAHLYVIWTPKVMDTTKLIEQETGASSFGRGELGVVNIPDNLHLIHIETQRFYKDHNVSYVAGKIGKVELLQANELYMQLPPATRDGLFQVIELLHGGTLSWLVHRTPEDDPRHTEINQMIADDKSCTIDFPYDGQVIQESSYDVRMSRQPTVKVVAMMVKDPDGNSKVLDNRWAGAGANGSVLEWFKWDGSVPGTYTLTAKAARPDGSAFTTPERRIRYAPTEQPSVADPRGELGTRLHQLRQMHGQELGFISAPLMGESLKMPATTIQVEKNSAATSPMSNVNKVEVQIDTGGWQPMQGTSPWTYPWQDYAPGAHDVTARFTYDQSKTFVTEPRRITYVPGHDYEITTPAIGAALDQATSEIKVETDAGIANVDVTVSAGTKTSSPNVPSGGRVIWPFTWTGYGFGEHTVKAKAARAAQGGNAKDHSVDLPERKVRYPGIVIEHPRQDEVIVPGPHYAIHAIGVGGMSAGVITVRVWRDNKVLQEGNARQETNGWWYDLHHLLAGYYKVVFTANNVETPERSFRVR